MKKLWKFSVLSGLALVSAQGFAADLSVGVSALHSNVELRSELADDESKGSIYENAPGFAVTADWDLGKSSLGLTLGRAQYYSGTESNVTSNSVIAHANMEAILGSIWIGTICWYSAGCRSARIRDHRS